MTYLRFLRATAFMACVFLTANTAAAFWFLPGFTPSNARNAQQTAMAPESPMPDPLESSTPDQIAEIPAPPPPSSNVEYTQEERLTAVADEPINLSIPESTNTLMAQSESSESAPLLTPKERPIPNEAVSGVTETGASGINEGQGPLSPLNFDLASLAVYQGRPKPIVTTNTLFDPEMDFVLSNQAFDMAYDLSDGALQPALSTFPISIFLEVEAGDTLSKLFQDVGISITETGQAAKALSENYNLGNLRPGQVLELELNGAVEPFGASRLQCLYLSPTSLVRIEVCRTAKGFVSKKSEIELNRVLVYATGPLRSGSVYLDGDAMNIESQVIANYVNALDSQLNFSRIQSVGDEIEMIYEAYFNDDGRLVEVGNVLYAAFNDQNQKTYEAFRFENDGKAAYFTRDARFTGQTNTLMRKPLGGGRLTSRFGMRTHPVYGDRRMHNGVDYGASCGTPIYASGDGTIRFSGWKGGYGRFISIKHGSTYTTNYAHMRSFANGMRPGVRVRKGQLIGRVGTTGVSTGCHLHYEVVKNGRHINPLSDHIPRGNDLTSAAKTRFLAFVNQLDSERENGITFDQALARARTGVY